MRFLLDLAALGTVILGAAHSYLGERTIFPRLLRCADLPRLRGRVEYTQSILRWAWHLTSLAWLGFGYLLLRLATTHPTHPPSTAEVARTIAIVFALTAVIAFATTRGKHIAWPLLTIVALASWFGV